MYNGNYAIAKSSGTEIDTLQLKFGTYQNEEKNKFFLEVSIC